MNEDRTKASYANIGITIRFGNHTWDEVAGTLQTSQGDNAPTVIIEKEEKNV